MERAMKCIICRHKFVADIPVSEIKSPGGFNNFGIGYLNPDFDRPAFDVRNMKCPKCGRIGSVEAEYRKIAEKIIKVSSKENFLLSLEYPWGYKPSKTRFKNGYQYYVAHYISVGDYPKIVEMDSREEVDRYIDNYPKFKKKEYFDKNYYLRKYLLDRVRKDKEFRKELGKLDGYKIEFEDKDPYLGVKYTKGGKSGKNVYGKLLMDYAEKIGDEEDENNF